MPWREQFAPAPMRRMAVVSPATHLRRVLAEVADAGVFEPDPPLATNDGPVAAVAQRVATEAVDAVVEVSPDPVDPEQLAAAGELGLLAGEAALERRTTAARQVGRFAALPGWIPTRDVETLRTRISPHGGALAELQQRRGMMPPTAHHDDALSGALRPLVSTYGTVPYRDIDPTVFAALAYMVMFGMMFGDVAHGLALVGLGLAAHRTRTGRLGAVHGAAPFLIGAGAAATGFGFLYGEAFGPTGLVPTIWLRPLDEPETLLIAGLLLGTCLLAMTFVLATINRWREAGPALALYDASGIGGALLFTGTALFVGGQVSGTGWLSTGGIVVVTVGAAATFLGLIVQSGPGASGVAQAVVEMFDTVLRLGSNVVSFTRLAAFGLTHAVISEVVWDGTVGLWDRSTVVGRVAAVALFVAGNIAGFALGALVGAIQALRLEYYELFSRLFTAAGRPFDPWHIPLRRSDPS